MQWPLKLFIKCIIWLVTLFFPLSEIYSLLYSYLWCLIRNYIIQTRRGLNCLKLKNLSNSKNESNSRLKIKLLRKIFSRHLYTKVTHKQSKAYGINLLWGFLRVIYRTVFTIMFHTTYKLGHCLVCNSNQFLFQTNYLIKKFFDMENMWLYNFW